MLKVGELTGILLAAGQGERFGGDKGLAQLPDGTPMALRSALNLRAVVTDVVCIVRPGDTVLSNLLREYGFKVIVAEDAALGMSASLQAGIRASREAAGWMVALADMPLIKLDTYQQLVATFNDQQRIIVPCLASETLSASPNFAAKEVIYGHPVSFPARFEPDLLALKGDKGAKSILQQYPATVQQVFVDDPGILQDFDTRQAFNRLFI